MTRVLRHPKDVVDELTKLFRNRRKEWLISFDTSAWPLSMALGAPTEQLASRDLDALHAWIQAWMNYELLGQVEWSERRWRSLGTQRLPERLLIRGPSEAADIIGQGTQWHDALKRYQQLRQKFPDLISDKLSKLDFFKDSDETTFERLLDVVDWVRSHPRPKIYVRQVPLGGIDTKFIEDNKSLLSALLDMILPSDAIDETAIGVSQFNQRYGFLDKPVYVRLRILDSSKSLVLGGGIQDLLIDSESFVRLDPEISRVFITENETNFLAFPHLEDSMIIFGAGYGFEMIRSAHWLLHRDVYYWGDIDTHGLAILSALRRHLPNARSLLMDKQSLLTHKELWGNEDMPHGADELPWLTTDEQRLFTDLKQNTWGANLRMEQERLNWDYASKVINELAHLKPALDQAFDMLPIDTTAAPQAVSLNASDLYSYFRPSECELRVFLRHHSETEAPLSPFQETLQRIGTIYELEQLSNFGAVTDMSQFDLLDRRGETRKAILQRHPVIYHPLLRAKVTLGGIEAEITGEPDFLILDGDRYIIRDLKIARRINVSDHPEIVLQMQLYAWLLMEVTGATPTKLEVQSSNGLLTEVPTDGGRAALAHLFEILKMKMMPHEPYSPVGWTKCAGCGFNERCWSNAIEKKDVACLVGVDKELARTLHQLDCGNIASLLADFDELSLGSIERRIGGRIQRVGKKASSIIQMANAMIENRAIPLEAPELPLSDNFVMFDLEGMPPYFEGVEKVYIWGMQVFGKRPSQFMPAAAGFGEDGDETAWKDFLNNARQIFNDYGEITFVHWHHYERVKLDMYIDRYGDPHGIAARVRQNLLDLLPITLQSIALPLPSYSLKVVEKYIGYQRSQEEFGGNWAMAKYIEAIESKNDALRKTVVEQVLLYNREDLEATWTVFTWIQNFFSVAHSLPKR